MYLIYIIYKYTKIWNHPLCTTVIWQDRVPFCCYQTKQCNTQSSYLTSEPFKSINYSLETYSSIILLQQATSTFRHSILCNTHYLPKWISHLSATSLLHQWINFSAQQIIFTIIYVHAVIETIGFLNHFRHFPERQGMLYRADISFQHEEQLKQFTDYKP
jgi:hypothetical protein